MKSHKEFPLRLRGVRMTLVVGIDPGTKGFACLAGTDRDGSVLRPTFWPAPRHDWNGEDAYDELAIGGLANAWLRRAVFLVVIEQQAPRRHSNIREGTVSSFTLGFGFGLWRGALAAAGFRPTGDRAHGEVDSWEGVSRETGPWVVSVQPQTWKARMGCLAHPSGEATHGARRKLADAATIKAAQQVDPLCDFRPTERSPGAKVPSPDKCVSLLLATYGLRWILGEKEQESPSRCDVLLPAFPRVRCQLLSGHVGQHQAGGVE